MPPVKTLVIIGFGDIAQRTAKILPATWHYHSYSRQASADEHQHLLDLDQKSIFTLPTDTDTLLYTAPPQQEGNTDQRMQHCLTQLPSHIKHIIYLSTTGVYGDYQGQSVTESSHCLTNNQRSLRRIDAEQQLQRWVKNHHTNLTILRVSGIYGASRLNIQRLLNNPIICPDEAPASNRIHEDDLASICQYFIENPSSGEEIYNISDNCHGTSSDIALEVAKQLKQPSPECISLQQAAKTFSPMRMSFLNESRHIDSSKLIAHIPALRYPTLSEGIAQALAIQQDDNNP